MSAQVWWLLLTRYQLCGSSPAMPATSHAVRWVSAIQPLLPAIQVSAMATSTGSIHNLTALKGRISLTIANSSNTGTQNSTLSASNSEASKPISGAGRKFSIAGS